MNDFLLGLYTAYEIAVEAPTALACVVAARLKAVIEETEAADERARNPRGFIVLQDEQRRAIGCIVPRAVGWDAFDHGLTRSANLPDEAQARAFVYANFQRGN